MNQVLMLERFPNYNRKAVRFYHLFSRISQSFIAFLIVQDLRAVRSYLPSDGKNMYNRVVLVISERIYTCQLGPTPNSQVPQGMFDPYDWSSSLQNILKQPLNITQYIKIKPQTVSKGVVFYFRYLKCLSINAADRRCLAVLI